MESKRPMLWALVWGREDGARAKVRNQLFEMVLGKSNDGSNSADNGAQDREVRAADVVDGLTKVADVGDLDDGSVVEVRFGDKVVALSMVNGEVFALSNVCPHAGGPLGDGELSGHILTCPTHGWSFDVRDGTCGVDSGSSLAVYEVKLLKNSVYLVNQ